MKYIPIFTSLALAGLLAFTMSAAATVFPKDSTPATPLYVHNGDAVYNWVQLGYIPVDMAQGDDVGPSPVSEGVVDALKCDVISVNDYLNGVGSNNDGIHGLNLVTGQAFIDLLADPDFKAFLDKYQLVIPPEINGMAYLDSGITTMEDGQKAIQVYFFTSDGCTGYYSGYLLVSAVEAGLDHATATAEKPVK